MEGGMQTQDFYNGLVQPSLRSLFSNFNSKLEVPLIHGFQTRTSSNTIGL